VALDVDYTLESCKANFQVIQKYIQLTDSPKNPSRMIYPVAECQTDPSKSPTQKPIHIGQLTKYSTILGHLAANFRKGENTLECVIEKLIPKQTSDQIKNS